MDLKIRTQRQHQERMNVIKSKRRSSLPEEERKKSRQPIAPNFNPLFNRIPKANPISKGTMTLMKCSSLEME